MAEGLSGRSSHAGFAGVLLAAMLAACDGGTSDKSQVDANIEDGGRAIELPPSIRKSSSYRCKDKSVLSVDFLDDDLSINLRDDNGITQLKAEEQGGPYRTGSMTLVANGNEITIEQPGRSPRHCKS